MAEQENCRRTERRTRVTRAEREKGILVLSQGPGSLSRDESSVGKKVQTKERNYGADFLKIHKKTGSRGRLANRRVVGRRNSKLKGHCIERD